ncbi:MAG TPA: prepilin-type N-terminal cleavage/methylation domain-containing protein [Anaeromyxobacter sp.]|nr:prepilin-type N-terminal cleavage/methylation domain-containing protein [Anaeromyxobacter sp.]
MEKGAKGFTLIELMIVTLVIGILAALAIPNFLKYQLRSKFSEASTNLEGLRKAEEALRQSDRQLAVNGVPVSAANYVPGQYWNLGGGVIPAGAVGSLKLPWTLADLAIVNGVDWEVEGPTYFQYGVATPCPGNPAVTQGGICYGAGAVSDIDGDGVLGNVALAKPSLAGAVPAAFGAGVAFPGPAGSGCFPSGGASTVYGVPCASTLPDVF